MPKCLRIWPSGQHILSSSSYTNKFIRDKLPTTAPEYSPGIRTVTKTLQNDSFFNFFNPPPVPEDPNEEMDEDTQALLTADFEIGHYIRERIIPRAVLFYTGEALDDEDFEEEEGEEGEEGDDEEEEDDPDYDPSKDKAAKGQQPPECKQQWPSGWV